MLTTNSDNNKPFHRREKEDLNLIDFDQSPAINPSQGRVLRKLTSKPKFNFSSLQQEAKPDTKPVSIFPSTTTKQSGSAITFNFDSIGKKPSSITTSGNFSSTASKFYETDDSSQQSASTNNSESNFTGNTGPGVSMSISASMPGKSLSKLPVLNHKRSENSIIPPATSYKSSIKSINFEDLSPLTTKKSTSPPQFSFGDHQKSITTAVEASTPPQAQKSFFATQPEVSTVKRDTSGGVGNSLEALLNATSASPESVSSRISNLSEISDFDSGMAKRIYGKTSFNTTHDALQKSGTPMKLMRELTKVSPQSDPFSEKLRKSQPLFNLPKDTAPGFYNEINPATKSKDDSDEFAKIKKTLSDEDDEIFMQAEKIMARVRGDYSSPRKSPGKSLQIPNEDVADDDQEPDSADLSLAYGQNVSLIMDSVPHELSKLSDMEGFESEPDIQDLLAGSPYAKKRTEVEKIFGEEKKKEVSKPYDHGDWLEDLEKKEDKSMNLIEFSEVADEAERNDEYTKVHAVSGLDFSTIGVAKVNEVDIDEVEVFGEGGGGPSRITVQSSSLGAGGVSVGEDILGELDEPKRRSVTFTPFQVSFKKDEVMETSDYKRGGMSTYSNRVRFSSEKEKEVTPVRIKSEPEVMEYEAPAEEDESNVSFQDNEKETAYLKFLEMIKEIKDSTAKMDSGVVKYKKKINQLEREVEGFNESEKLREEKQRKLEVLLQEFYISKELWETQQAMFKKNSEREKILEDELEKQKRENEIVEAAFEKLKAQNLQVSLKKANQKAMLFSFCGIFGFVLLSFIILVILFFNFVRTRYLPVEYYGPENYNIGGFGMDASWDDNKKMFVYGAKAFKKYFVPWIGVKIVEIANFVLLRGQEREVEEMLRVMSEEVMVPI